MLNDHKKTLYWTLLLSVILLGFLLRMHQMVRPFLQAEYLYLHNLLAAQDFKDFGEGLSGQMQPCLDYVLRKMLWIPLLGVSERSFRIPAMVCSLATVGVSFTVAFRYLRSSLFFAFLVGCAVALNGVEISLVGEGRHYSFAGLVSVLWCSYFVLGRPTQKKFFAASLAFANAHFFSFPTLATGYFWQTIEVLKKRNYFEAFKWIASCSLVFGITIYFNYAAFHSLSAHAARRPFGIVLKEVFELWRTYFQLFDFPVFWPVLWLGIFLNRRKPENLKLALLCFVTLPGFLFLGRLRSDYPFGARYFEPFRGFGIVAMILGLEGLRDFWAQGIKSRPLLRTKSVQSVLVVLLLICFGGPALVQRAAHLEFPRLSPYFSDTYRSYMPIKALERPLFVIDACECPERARYYLKYAGNDAFAYGAHIVDFCFMEPRRTRVMFQKFLEAHPNGLVILDEYAKPGGCDDRTYSVNAGGHRLEIKKTGQGRDCLWVVAGVRSKDDLKAAMDAVDFRNRGNFWE